MKVDDFERFLRLKSREELQELLRIQSQAVSILVEDGELEDAIFRAWRASLIADVLFQRMSDSGNRRAA